MSRYFDDIPGKEWDVDPLEKGDIALSYEAISIKADNARIGQLWHNGHKKIVAVSKTAAGVKLTFDDDTVKQLRRGDDIAVLQPSDYLSNPWS